MLKDVKTKRELKKAIHNKHILVNAKAAKDEKHGLTLFDNVSIVPAKKSYKLSLAANGKFIAEEVPEKESKTKISKIVDKKILKGKKVQLNLSDGKNVLSEEKCNTNDSVVLNLEKRSIEKILPLAEKTKVVVIAGKHAGKTGVVDKIDNDHKMVDLKTKERNINILIKQVMVIQ
jgi:small subunit ribosomal protein S4e